MPAFDPACAWCRYGAVHYAHEYEDWEPPTRASDGGKTLQDWMPERERLGLWERYTMLRIDWEAWWAMACVERG